MSENLVPQSERTKDEQREIARSGGVASGKARREKKAFREALEAILSMPINAGKCHDLDNIKNFSAIRGKNISVQEAILISQIQKAMKGDTRSAEFVRDTSGQKPIEKIAHAAVGADIIEEIEALVKRNDA